MLHFFQMTEEQDRIIFLCHSPDHTNTYTTLIKVPNKLEFPGVSVEGKK